MEARNQHVQNTTLTRGAMPSSHSSLARCSLPDHWADQKKIVGCYNSSHETTKPMKRYLNGTRSSLGLFNLHYRSIRVQNWGFYFLDPPGRAFALVRTAFLQQVIMKDQFMDPIANRRPFAGLAISEFSKSVP